MTVENQIPSFSKTRRILGKLASIVQDLSNHGRALPDAPQADFSKTVQALEQAINDLDQERVEAQQQVKEEFNLVLNRTGKGYLVLDHQGRYQEVNPVAAQQIIRRPVDEIIGHTYAEIPPGIDAQEFGRQLTLSLSEKRPVQFLAPGLLDGQHYEILGYPREGVIEFILTDITGREQAQMERDRLMQANRHQKELLEAVLQQMPAGVLIVDVATHQIIMQNRQIAEIFQQPVNLLSLGQEDGLQGYHLDNQPYQPEEWPFYRAIHSGELVENEEIRITLANGSDRYLSVNAAPILGSDGEIDAAAIILFDITDRRRTELNNHFLARMGEQLLRLEDQRGILAFATRALGEYLQATRCILDEVNLKERTIIIDQDYARDYPSLLGVHLFSPFHDQIADTLGRGESIQSENTAADPLTASIFEPALRDLGILSFVAIPRHKDRQWTATLTVMDDKPRVWRADEINLLRSSADLIWLALEGAKLLKDLEITTTRFNVALKNAPVIVHSLDRNLRYKWVYKPPVNFSVDEVLGKRYDELVPPEAVRELMELKQSVLESGIGTRKEVHTHLNGEDQILDVTLEPLHDAWGAVIGLTVAGIDITSQRRLEAEMSERSAQIEIHHEILRHREMERMEVARDLHDGPLQELIGLNFAINEISMISDDAEREQAIQEVQDSLQKQIQDLRAFCYELRPPALTPFGFERAVRSHLEQFEKKNPQLQFHLNLMHDDKILTDDLRLALYRAYREALNNVVRHSQASEVWITFRFDDNRAELEIRDNGKGFKVPKQWLQLAREGHLGMVGMHERVEAAGGKIEIDSAPGQGTLVKVTIPR